MKKPYWLICAAVSALIPPSQGQIVQDVYDLTLRLRVPRVYNNTESLGYRKPNNQIIKGQLLITYDDSRTSEGYAVWPEISIDGLYNKTHKLSNGRNVVYDPVRIYESDPMPRINVIGNNKTLKFKTATAIFKFEANPSYNIGLIEEDNTLIVTCSGFGSVGSYKGTPVIKNFSGTCAGQIGCGCMAWSHLSPTRFWWWCGWLNCADDVAAVEGRWAAKWKYRVSCSN